MRFHHAILSICLGYPKDLDGWRLTKKRQSHTETEYFCSCLQAQGFYNKSQISFGSTNRDKVKSLQLQMVWF